MNRASLDYIMCKRLDDYPPKKWFQWDVFCLKIRFIIFQLALPVSDNNSEHASIYGMQQRTKKDGITCIKYSC